jgi:predicted ATPase
VIAAICRRLDGIPLAIELAAARAPALGTEALAALLDNRFHLLTDGRRTALPRHRTLRATLDWSFELLTAEERLILRRLAIFAGPFDLEAARAVLASAELTPSDVFGGVADLIAKSLVAANVEVASAPFRLLDTMRAYALEKLAESSEREWLARRHAEYHRDLFERGESEWASRPAADWLTYYGRRVDNLRAALDWAFSSGGDAPIGVALTAAAVPLWMQLSLLDECRDRTEQALLALGLATRRDARAEMKLQAALAASLAYTRAATVPEVGAAWTKAFEIAQSLDDGDYQLRSLLGLWSFHNRRGQNRVALALAERFCGVAANRSDANDRLVGERIIGTSHFSLGDLRSAREHIERALAGGGLQDHRDVIRFQADSRIALRNCMAWILWLQGFLDQAMGAAETTVEEARATNHVNSICYALALCACPIALSIGDLAAAERYLEMLLDYTARHSQPRWRASGRNHQGVLAIRRGDVGTGLLLMRETLDAPGAAHSGLTYPMLLGVFAEASGTIGRTSEGLAAVEEGLAHCERHEERWCMAELLRIKGELLLLHRPDGAAAAEDHFRQALDWADRQGALFWQLRAATSLARLMRGQDRPIEAIAVLRPVYDRFSEGFETADLKGARMLLGHLR